MSSPAPHQVDLSGLRLSPTAPAFFRYRRVGERVVVTSLEGRYALLTPDEFRAFASGAVDGTSELGTRLAGANLLREGYDAGRAVEMLRERKHFLRWGPNLHMIVVTLRCPSSCVYCHASRVAMDDVGTDMNRATADKTVDLVLQSTSPAVTIEFQGGEPLANYPVIQHIVETARERNKAVGKRLEFTLVSNLALLDEEKLRWLLDNHVQICTSVDGPRALHDSQRILPDRSAWDTSTGWIRRINQAYRERGLDPTLYHVEALLTTTRQTLPRWKEVVDTYVELGCGALFLRPMDPFGFAGKAVDRLAYGSEEFLDFYRQAVDYMLDLNRQGVQILERYAAIFLTKILRGEDPNFSDIRSPSGAGIGTLAYHFDGKIFTCDEARMLHEMGDDTFAIGNVETSTYREVVGHEVVRAALVAGNVDARPDCVNCAYNPYCGVSPSHCHGTQGTLFGRMRENMLCGVYKGIQDYLFDKLAAGDPGTLEIFRRWTTNRLREHFFQSGPDRPGGVPVYRDTRESEP